MTTDTLSPTFSLCPEFMRLVVDGNRVHVWLSERNLLALLTKLKLEGSARTLVWENDGVSLTVTSETNEVHYDRGYPPGEMNPITEEMIRSYENT